MSPAIFLRNCGVAPHRPRETPYAAVIRHMMAAMPVGDPEKFIDMQSDEWRQAMEDYVRNEYRVREWLGLRTIE